MGDLEVDTRLEPRGEGRFRAMLSRDWEIWGPNGGYVAVIALRAAGLVARVPRPSSFAAHFLGVADFAPVDVEVRVLKAGRRSESLAVSITQDGRPILEAMVRTAAAGDGLEHDVAEIPEKARPADLRSVEELVAEYVEEPEGDPYPFWSNLEGRPIWPERFADDRRAYPPLARQWYRFRPRAAFDDPWVDAGRALILIDTMSWPAAAQPHPEAPFTAPNIDVAAWFHRAEPESEWLFADHESPVAEAGLMGTHARVYGESGRLLASGGAQLFCVPAPGRGQG